MRIINYNSEFIKPAPFYFKLPHDTIKVLEKNNVNITLEIFGDERQKVFINYNNESKKLKKLSPNQCSHAAREIYKKILHFYFSANNELSKEYNVFLILQDPKLNAALTITPQKHTNASIERIENLEHNKHP